MRDADPPQIQELPPSPQPAEPPPRADERLGRSALLIVFLVVMIDLLGFGMVQPLLPIYADEYLAALFPDGHSALLEGLILGVITASFSFMQFLFAPLWGRLSDRIGRRPVLLAGLVASALFYTLFGVASQIEAVDPGTARFALLLLFVFRCGTGLAGATIATAQAVIADATPPERRSRGMALIGAAFGIGFTFGPLLGIAALETGNRGMAGFLAAGLSVLAFLLGLALLPETLRVGAAGAHRHWLDWNGLANALRSPTIGTLVLTFFLATFAFAMFESTLALYNGAVFGLTKQGSNLAFVFVGLILVLVQGVLYRRLAPRVPEAVFLRLGVAFLAVGMVGLAGLAHLARSTGATPTPAHFTGFGAVLAVVVTGFAFVTPSVQSLISRRSDPTRQGEILGVNQSAAAMARILGPLLGLLLFKVEASHALPYSTGAVLLGLLWLRTRRLP